MKVKLPIIGQIATGKDTRQTTTEKVVEKFIQSEMGASFLDLSSKDLSNYKTISERLLTSFNGWVFANVSVLAEEISRMEFELYQTKMVNGDLEFEEIEEHPVLDLLDQWNSFTPSSQAVYLLECFLELSGDCFIAIEGSGSNITNMYLLRPDKIELEIGDANDNYMVTSYIYKDTVDGKEVLVNYSPDEIIHIKTPNPVNPYRGKSVVEATAIDIDTDNLAQEMIKMFFQNGAVPSIVLTSEQRITKDDIHRLQTDLKKTYGGVKNAFKSMILGNGLSPVTISQSSKEMQFLEIELAMRDKIMTMFKNTKASLGIVEDVNRANAEATLLSWKQSTIKPKIKRIVDSLNEFLVPRYGDNLILTFSDPVPEDADARVTKAQSLYSSGIITLNEAREEASYDPLDNGDQLNSGLVATDLPAADAEADKSEKSQMPKNIKLVNYKKHLRKNKLYSRYTAYKGFYAQAHELASKVIMSSKKPAEKPYTAPESNYFSNDDVWAYYSKQMHLVEAHEQIFETKLVQFINSLEEKAISNLPKAGRKSYKKKDFILFEEQAEIRAGIDLFTPLQTEIAKLSALEAYNLLGTTSGYLPSDNLIQNIENSTKLFTRSFIGTDITKLNNILEAGIEAGSSIPQIATSIRTVFGDFKINQIERIVRTEVLTASNYGALDAFEESGVVEAKQWLTAMDSRTCAYCAPLNGTIVGLSTPFFKKGESYLGNSDKPILLDYRNVLAPPLHASCRCTIIPVLKDIRELGIDKSKEEIKELKEYAKSLEELLEVTE